MKSLSFPNATTGIMSKRRRLLPSTPPLPPPTNQNPNPKPNPNHCLAAVPKSRRSLGPSLLSSSAAGEEWQPLPLSRSEISLALTLPTGQTFRWRRTGDSRFTGVVGCHLVSLRHGDGGDAGRVDFLAHGPGRDTAAARVALDDYLNVGVSLRELWRGFSEADARFAELAGAFDGGARVLRQDPVECLFQFLCSSNNNIGRIEKMVGVLSSFGDYLGSVGGFDFHRFPTIEQLALVSERQLREAGFGYRFSCLLIILINE